MWSRLGKIETIQKLWKKIDIYRLKAAAEERRGSLFPTDQIFRQKSVELRPMLRRGETPPSVLAEEGSTLDPADRDISAPTFREIALESVVQSPEELDSAIRGVSGKAGAAGDGATVVLYLQLWIGNALTSVMFLSVGTGMCRRLTSGSRKRKRR